MPKVAAVLSSQDCEVIGCPSAKESQTRIAALMPSKKPYVNNAAHRLGEVAWLTEQLESSIRQNRVPLCQEGLLNNQLYLLLTCADVLGRDFVPPKSKVRPRFDAFFNNLSPNVQASLRDAFLALKTTQQLQLSGKAQIEQLLSQESPAKRYEWVVDFLYQRRCWYTHEANYPQLGYHPNLSVLQNTRLGVKNTATLGEPDRMQSMHVGQDYYFVYITVNDPIAEIRDAILRGLGKILGFPERT